jgi:hypothetical protein
MSLFNWGKSPDWKGQILAVGEALATVRDGLVEPEEMRTSSQEIARNVQDHLKTLKKEGRFIFSDDGDTDRLTESNVDLLRSWLAHGNPPSLAALCIYAIENLDLKILPDAVQAILGASILGEVGHSLPYHNNMHFRKVLLQLLRLVYVHNSIFKDTPRALDDNQAALLIIACCVHDFGHDGMGNTLKGIHHPGFAERRSFTMASPYLNKLGMSEPGLFDLKVTLLSTDVSPLGDPGNYMNQMKAAYRFHFLGERKGLQTLNLDAELSRLQKNPALTIMSLMLHEADISTSAGLAYDVTKYETAIYAQEIGEDARPSHIIEFLDTVCQKRMLSDAAQKLYAANMARIYALAVEDVKNGNQPLPKAEFSDLIIYKSGERPHKTIN